MAYSPANPPALVAQGIGGHSRIWLYSHTDPASAFDEPGYITNARALGMVTGDAVHVVDTANGLSTVSQVTVAEDGTGTLSAAGSMGFNGVGFIGFNLTGLEYAWGTSPANADLDYVASLGGFICRIPTAWERWEPTLGGALDSAYVAIVRDLIARCHARGISTIIEVHNYGRYDPDYDPPEGSPAGVYDHGGPGTHAGSYVLGSPELPISSMVGLWERIATEFEGEPGLVGYGLMNEPQDLASPNLIDNGNAFEGANWFPTNGAVLTPNAATDPFGGNAAWTMTSGTGEGYGSIHRASTPVNDAGDHALGLWMRIPSGSVDVAFLADFVPFGTPATLNSTWQKPFDVFDAPDGDDVTIGFTIQSAPGVTIEIYTAQFEAGTELSDLGPGTVWQSAAQATITAIRAIDADMPIIVMGDNYGAAATWVADNGSMTILTDPEDNMVIEAHHYLDSSGVYTDTYTEIGLDAASGATQAAGYLAWLASNSKRGLLGEFAVPGPLDANAADYLVVLGNWIDAYHAAGVPTIWWEYASHQPTDPEWWPSNTVIRLDRLDADQSRALLLRSKAKAGPFTWG